MQRSVSKRPLATQFLIISRILPMVCWQIKSPRKKKKSHAERIIRIRKITMENREYMYIQTAPVKKAADESTDDARRKTSGSSAVCFSSNQRQRPTTSARVEPGSAGPFAPCAFAFLYIAWSRFSWSFFSIFFLTPLHLVLTESSIYSVLFT